MNLEPHLEQSERPKKKLVDPQPRIGCKYKLVNSFHLERSEIFKQKLINSQVERSETSKNELFNP